MNKEDGMEPDARAAFPSEATREREGVVMYIPRPCATLEVAGGATRLLPRRLALGVSAAARVRRRPSRTDR